MAKTRLQWWVIPGIITGCLTMLGGIGTCAVKYAAFETLPTKVEAVEQKNDAQDSAIDKLTAIQQTWQNIYQQQQQRTLDTVPRPSGLREYDPSGECWDCPLEDREACFAQRQWVRCP